MGGDRCSFLARIIVYKTNGEEVKLYLIYAISYAIRLPSGNLGRFSLAGLSGKEEVQKSSKIKLLIMSLER